MKLSWLKKNYQIFNKNHSIMDSSDSAKHTIQTQSMDMAKKKLKLFGDSFKTRKNSSFYFDKKHKKDKTNDEIFTQKDLKLFNNNIKLKKLVSSSLILNTQTNNMSLLKYKINTVKKPLLLKLGNKELIHKIINNRKLFLMKNKENIYKNRANTTNNKLTNGININKNENLFNSNNKNKKEESKILNKPNEYNITFSNIEGKKNSLINTLFNKEKIKKAPVTPFHFSQEYLMEIKDQFPYGDARDLNLKKDIRISLKSGEPLYQYEPNWFLDQQKSLANYVNYQVDINILPNLQNKFLFHNPVEDKFELTELLSCKNILTHDITRSINKVLINKMRMEEQIYKLKNDGQEINEAIFSYDYAEKLNKGKEKTQDPEENWSRENTEVPDYFQKAFNYKNIRIASERDKKILFTNFKQ